MCGVSSCGGGYILGDRGDCKDHDVRAIRSDSSSAMFTEASWSHFSHDISRVSIRREVP